MSTTDPDVPITRPKATDVEQHGIDTIPAHHRHSGPVDLFRIQFGGANTFATVILGTFPVLLGLSLWQAVAATVTSPNRLVMRRLIELLALAEHHVWLLSKDAPRPTCNSGS